MLRLICDHWFLMLDKCGVYVRVNREVSITAGITSDANKHHWQATPKGVAFVIQAVVGACTLTTAYIAKDILLCRTCQ